MEKKISKPTNAQLQRRIKNALAFVPKDKNYLGVFFSDKGLRLEVNSDTAVISTGYHKHLYSSYTSSGISRPYLYTRRIIEIANEHLNDCMTENGYSFGKLIDFLKTKEDRTEYNICVFVDWWLFNLFQPLFSIGETDAEQFLVYESYIHNIARNSILLSEKTDNMTNKQFLDKMIESIREMTADMEERVLFEKKTDEEVARENIEAIQEQELNEQAQQ